MHGYLIEHRHNRLTVNQRADNGFLSATDLSKCTPHLARIILIKKEFIPLIDTVACIERVNPVAIVTPGYVGTWVHPTLAPMFVRRLNTPAADSILRSACSWIETWRAGLGPYGTDDMDAGYLDSLRPFIIARLGTAHHAMTNLRYIIPGYIESIDILLNDGIILVHPCHAWQAALMRAVNATLVIGRTIAVYLYGPGDRRHLSYLYAKCGVFLVNRDAQVERHQPPVLTSEWLLALDL